MAPSTPRRLRFRLWWKLAAMAALGVVVMHAVHLTLGLHIASRTIAIEQEQLGRSIARLVADQAADALLVEDLVTLDTICSSAVSADRRGVAYCLIMRDGRSVATAFDGPVPPALLKLRAPGDHSPVIVRRAGMRVLDLSEPILDGIGEVRVGLNMTNVAEMRRRLVVELGLLALAVIAAGLVAALAMGRSIASPVRDMLVAADHFDPSLPGSAPVLAPRGSDEIAVLADRFNHMILRLRASYEEQERARQRSIETERLVALGSLVAGVAHEVNNPLAGLKNCVHRLNRRDLSEAKRDEYLSLMGEGLARIENVVKGLLDFARPHAPVLEATRTSELALRAVTLLGPQLARTGIRCRVVDDAEDGLVLADRHGIGQALVNLLLNAAHAVHGVAEIRLRLRTRDGMHGVAVEDDGPGIPPEIREHILEPFFTTKPAGEGTGLGLPVTKTIVEGHGGQLTFEFPERGGTVVTVWLRALEAPSRPAGAAARPP
jgi:two-component system NtrC family sensor kinase